MIIKSTDWNRTCIYIHFSTRERGTEREREGKSFGHVTINGRRLEIRTVWRRRVDYVYKHTHNISYWKMICARFTPITLFQTFWTTVFPNCLYLPFARSKFRFRFIISSPFLFSFWSSYSRYAICLHVRTDNFICKRKLFRMLYAIYFFFLNKIFKVYVRFEYFS